MISGGSIAGNAAGKFGGVSIMVLQRLGKPFRDIVAVQVRALFPPHKCSYGGTGRRAALKMLYLRVCRFDSDWEYKTTLARMAELVDALHSKRSFERSVGSIPTMGTNT